MEGANYLEELS